MNPKEPSLNISATQLQEAVEDLEPKKNLQNIACLLYTSDAADE